MLTEEIWKDVEGYEYQTAGGFRWRYKVITTDNGKS